MDHHDDVRSSLQRFAITRGLIASVSVVGVVDERRQSRGVRRSPRCRRGSHRPPGSVRRQCPAARRPWRRGAGCVMPASTTARRCPLIMTRRTPVRTAERPMKTVATSCLLFAIGVGVNLTFGRRGFLPLDQSIVFDGGWRLVSGQVPFHDLRRAQRPRAVGHPGRVRQRARCPLVRVLPPCIYRQRAVRDRGLRSAEGVRSNACGGGWRRRAERVLLLSTGGHSVHGSAFVLLHDADVPGRRVGNRRGGHGGS